MLCRHSLQNILMQFVVKPIYHHGMNNMEKIHGQMNREWNGTKLTEYPQSSLESLHIKCYDKKQHATFGHQTDARA